MLTAIRFSILILVMGGLFYPLAITGLGQMLFREQANGSLIRRTTGQVVGSRLLGQTFSKPEYFHPRPAVNSYDASNSGGSNFGATNHKLIARVQQDSATYSKENPLQTVIPVDAVTASASNLDPHISLANALIQIPRVAGARHVEPALLRHLVVHMAEKPLFASTPYLNVLQLNLALEQNEWKRH